MFFPLKSTHQTTALVGTLSPSAASNIISLPLAFVRSGGIYLNDGIAYYVGHALYNWSRVVLSAPVAYFFGVDPAEVYPSFSVNRWYAFPPR